MVIGLCFCCKGDYKKVANENVDSVVNTSIDIDSNKILSKLNESELILQINKNPDSINLTLPLTKTVALDLILSGKFIKENDGSTSIYKPTKLSVFQNKNRIQVINLNTYEIKLYLDEFLDNPIRYKDLNFDGFLDLQVLNNAGATGNYWFHTWLFDKNKNQLVYNNLLSSLSAVEVDSVKKLIHTYERSGMDWQMGVFLKPISTHVFDTIRIISTEQNNPFCIYTIEDKINNKWLLVNRIKIKNSQLEEDYYNDPIFLKGLTIK